MKKLLRRIVAIATLLFASSAVPGPVGVIEENQLPAVLSFDYAAGLLGMVYGVDASSPSISASGHVSSSGFDWTVTGATYQGLSLAWSAIGAYDAAHHSVHWTGDGMYDGHAWTMGGDVEWLSGTEFRVRHAIDIPGIQSVYTSDNTGVPSWDNGLAADPPFKVKYEIDRSTSWFLIIPIGSKVDSVTVTVEGGVITEDTLKIVDDKTKVGVEIKNLGGSIEIGGGEFTKTIKVVPVPEPSTWILFAVGLVGVARSAWRRHR
jgi:hypothetical protein